MMMANPAFLLSVPHLNVSDLGGSRGEARTDRSRALVSGHTAWYDMGFIPELSCVLRAMAGRWRKLRV